MLGKKSLFIVKLLKNDKKIDVLKPFWRIKKKERKKKIDLDTSFKCVYIYNFY